MAPITLALATILQAHRFIIPYIHHTRLIRSSYLSRLSGGDVWLKLECHQPTGSFKVRGALNKMGQLTADQKAGGIVTASAGNHALGLAYAAQSLGDVKTDIFVPITAPRTKADKLGRFPITVHLEGHTYEDAHQAAHKFAQQTAATEISAYDDLDVIAGQATVGLEILTDLPQTDAILVPVGGGGLIAGISVVAHTLKPGCRIIGVQPQASPSAQLSLRDGIAYDPYAHDPTLADGLAGGFGTIPLQLARHLIDQVLLSGEQELKKAILTLLDQEQLVVEPSGAIAIVPILQSGVDWRGQTVVCVLSGGNLDSTLLRDILVEFTADE